MKSTRARALLLSLSLALLLAARIRESRFPRVASNTFAGGCGHSPARAPYSSFPRAV